MKLSEIRNQLVTEHEALRAMVARTSSAAEQILEGSVVELDLLRATLTTLDQALAAHNRHEDELLRGIIRTVDAWGPQRESLMSESHATEHSAITQSLEACVSVDDRFEAAKRARELVARMLLHMDSEEREVLHPDILRDDVVSIQGFSG